MNLAEIRTFLSEVNNVSIVVRLTMAIVLGGFIGIERGRKRRPAGFRTHMLVCLGSALAMMTNQYIIQMYGFSDPARLGAQVISGIGFLGAGTIIVTGRRQVRGLTTAAGLWASACMGLAIGIGFYEAAVVTAVSIWFVSSMLHRLDEYVHSKSKVMELYVEFERIGCISSFLDDLRVQGIKVTEIEMTKVNSQVEEVVAAIMTIRSEQKQDHATMLAMIGRIAGVNFVESL